jgi:hypothetical protein
VQGRVEAEAACGLAEAGRRRPATGQRRRRWRPGDGDGDGGGTGVMANLGFGSDTILNKQKSIFD